MQHERNQYKHLIQSALHKSDVNDTNYIFLRFVIDYLPKGLVGLLIAIIFMAAWGSIAAALNALAGCSLLDFHLYFRDKKKTSTDANDLKDYQLSKWHTLAWGIFCIATAEFATGMGSLIEAVNILGSLFYGVILGIFLVGFFTKNITGKSVLTAAVLSEILVICLFIADKQGIIGCGFLWLNAAGTCSLVCLAMLFNQLFGLKKV